VSDQPRLIAVAYPLKQASLNSMHERKMAFWPAYLPLSPIYGPNIFCAGHWRLSLAL